MEGVKKIDFSVLTPPISLLGDKNRKKVNFFISYFIFYIGLLFDSAPNNMYIKYSQNAFYQKLMILKDKIEKSKH